MESMVSWCWDRGNFRKKNEDSFTLQRVRLNNSRLFWNVFFGKKNSEAALLAVCDGIGGLPEGESASGLVAEELTRWFYQEGIQAMKHRFWKEGAKKSVLGAWEEIQRKLEKAEQEEGICCGTTCTMALIKDGKYLIFHTGDSRALCLGGRKLRDRFGRRERILTKDHSEGGALRRCLGAFGFQMPDVISGQLCRGELLLLCTDGFYRLAAEGFFKGCLSGAAEDVSEDYKRLKGAAGFLKAQGEKDNLTALLYRRI